MASKPEAEQAAAAQQEQQRLAHLSPGRAVVTLEESVPLGGA